MPFSLTALFGFFPLSKERKKRITRKEETVDCKNKVLLHTYFLKMIRLFKKVQARKITVFAPEFKDRDAKESKKIIQKKKVPRFLTREITLKLRKGQPINGTLAAVPVAFTFYLNESKSSRGKVRTWSQIANCLNKYNKNLNGSKKHKSIGSEASLLRSFLSPWSLPSVAKQAGVRTKDKKLQGKDNSIINTRPVKVLQKRTGFAGMLHRAFLNIRPFFNILQKTTDLLLKTNAYLIREACPFIYAGLKGASTIGGFKKVLYNKVLVQDRRLKPAYNRRKHSISHYMVVQNQLARLDKTFVYLGKNKLASIVGLILKSAYCKTPARAKIKKYNYFNNKLSIRRKAIPDLVSVIESQEMLLLWRNQFSSSLTKSRQDHRQGASQNLGVFCKSNTAIVLKE